ncbi:MAG: FAD-binding oxidoreductase [Kiritimatiellia bacterium]
MSTHCVRTERVLSPAEYQEIDAFCSGRKGVESLDDLASFLAREFSVELKLDPDIVVGFVTDQSNLPGSAHGVCSPRNERECAAILRACFRTGIPVTVSGGRSNLTGSATPQGGIVLSLARLLTPEVSVDENNLLVRAPAGIVLEQMRQMVLQQTEGRLLFPVDPTSRNDAVLGGAIACNASGFTPGEPGAVRYWVEALEVLLMNGRKIVARRGDYVSRNGNFVLHDDEGETLVPIPRYPRPAIKNAGGPFSTPTGTMDFVDLIVGSEGIFGVITGAALRLRPRPTDYLDLFFSLPSEQHALTLLNWLREKLPGGVSTLIALEYFGLHCRRYMKHEERLFLGTNPVAIYLQAPVDSGDLEAAAQEWVSVLDSVHCGIVEDSILLLDNERDRTIFFEARHSLPANSLEVVHQRGTYTIMTDTVVPPDRFAELLAFTHNLLRSQGLEYLAFGHFGDCHLHFNILPEQGQIQRAVEAYDQIIEKSAQLGGVYSGEHGTGKRKRKDFVKCYGSEGVEQVRRCKAALDPLFLLNRGNVIES